MQALRAQWRQESQINVNGDILTGVDVKYVTFIYKNVRLKSYLEKILAGHL